MSMCRKWTPRLGALAVLPVFLGCGGGSSEPSSAVLAPLTASPESQSFKEVVVWPVPARASISARPVTTPSIFRSASGQPGSVETAVHLQLLGPDGVPASSLELPPVRGVGYASVKARISSVRAGGETPVDNVRPFCPSSVQCEYRVAGRDRLDLRYVVKLPDENVARLSATGNEILVTAKQTNLPVRTPVTITLEIGNHTSSARVAYLGIDATQESIAQETQTTTVPMPRPIKPAGSRYPFSGAN